MASENLNNNGIDHDNPIDSNNEPLFEHQGTVINDPIHGHIELDPLCMSIINTPQFQRLRCIKQVGSGSMVYPGAVHTRFEHSIGVCHLAESLCRILQQKQPELMISRKDISCVAIAGLCHDLGHGPFSHLYDKVFIPMFNVDWKHEDGSVAMFDYLVETNNLRHLFSDEDFTFIKEQIRPPAHKKDYRGRKHNKLFLYEIVANKRNGIDVDKWDYFLRDSYYLGLKVSFDPSRLMKFVRVIDVNGEMQICARAKEVDNLYEMFHCRISLYKQAYLHKTTMIIDYMICEALRLANDHILFAGSNGKQYKMSEAIQDMSAYWKMTDDIIMRILHSTDPQLGGARQWVERLFHRRLPKIVGMFKETDNQELPWSEAWIHDQLMSENSMLKLDLTCKDFIIKKRCFSYGMNEENPIERCMFYNKHHPDVAYQVRKNQVSSFLPEKFQEIQYLVFCDDARKREDANRCYEAMCSRYNLLVSKGAEQNGLMMTPLKSHDDHQSGEPNVKIKKLMKNLSHDFTTSDPQ